MFSNIFETVHNKEKAPNDQKAKDHNREIMELSGTVQWCRTKKFGAVIIRKNVTPFRFF